MPTKCQFNTHVQYNAIHSYVDTAPVIDISRNIVYLLIMFLLCHDHVFWLHRKREIQGARVYNVLIKVRYNDITYVPVVIKCQIHIVKTSRMK